jgi:hypothetical protein
MSFNISKFTTEINKKGVLTTNRFLVTFGFPQNHYLRNIDEKAFLNTDDQKSITLRCEAVQFPGMSFATADIAPRAGYGPQESNPYGVIYDDVTLVFIVDAKSKIHDFFYSWVNSIVNFNAKGQGFNITGGPLNSYAYEVGYKDNYVSTISIDVFEEIKSNEREDASGTSVPFEGAGVKSMTAKMYRAFPKMLTPIDLNWGNEGYVKFAVPFTYTDFNVEYYSKKEGLPTEFASLPIFNRNLGDLRVTVPNLSNL